MSWLLLLGIVVVFVALFALTGWKPEGTRRVAGTRLMTVARIVLTIIALILVWIVLQGGSVPEL